MKCWLHTNFFVSPQWHLLLQNRPFLVMWCKNFIGVCIKGLVFSFLVICSASITVWIFSGRWHLKLVINLVPGEGWECVMGSLWLEMTRRNFKNLEARIKSKCYLVTVCNTTNLLLIQVRLDWFFSNGKYWFHLLSHCSVVWPRVRSLSIHVRTKTRELVLLQPEPALCDFVSKTHLPLCINVADLDSYKGVPLHFGYPTSVHEAVTPRFILEVGWYWKWASF